MIESGYSAISALYDYRVALQIFNEPMCPSISACALYMYHTAYRTIRPQSGIDTTADVRSLNDDE